MEDKHTHISFRQISPLRALALGFALIMLTGGALLCLPFATRGDNLSFIDALFTAASATCVTGLVVTDTYTTFTGFGQAVILALIQTGGLGFMTFASLFALLVGRKIGLKQRSILMESVSNPQLGGIVNMIKRVLITVFAAEALGAAALATRMIPRLGWGEGIWHAIFHSVSAFCNAGFDLMGGIAPYASLTPFVSDIVVNITVIALILAGGIGFWVWDDIRTHGVRFSKYRLHSKLMLCVSAALIIIPALLFYFLESGAALSGLNAPERALAALFQAVTPRTAGFNTIDTSLLSEAGSVLTMLLMVIGGGAGSTAGGLKATTFTLILLSLIARARGAEDVNAFKRRVDASQLRAAHMSGALYMLAIATGLFAFTCAQPGIMLKDALFEVISAIGTVGMSTGITRALGVPGKLIIIVLMYLGRVGLLSLMLALANPRAAARARNPEERIVV